MGEISQPETLEEAVEALKKAEKVTAALRLRDQKRQAGAAKLIGIYSTTATDSFSLPEGRVLIEWPRHMSERSTKLVGQWILVVMEKIDDSSRAEDPARDLRDLGKNLDSP